MHRITYFRFVHGYFLVQNRLSRGTLRQIQLFPEQEKTVLLFLAIQLRLSQINSPLGICSSLHFESSWLGKKRLRAHD